MINKKKEKGKMKKKEIAFIYFAKIIQYLSRLHMFVCMFRPI